MTVLNSIVRPGYAVLSLSFNFSSAEQIEYSERYVKIKQAEKAIREKYWIVPDM